jgi:lysophospholipase L1-like esterase
MSEPPPGSPPQRSPFFRPGTFLVGLLLGLALCSLVARRVSSQSYHRGFTRFYLGISPEAQYYPTLDEMKAIVRSSCRPDQTLVIVGGNSIFNGVGQPPGSVWTGELQNQLGDGYFVVNFAFRGALCTDGGAVVAEALRKEFPRQIYVANTSPFGAVAPYGTEPYRYLFWEALARGELEAFPPRDADVSHFRRRYMSWGERFDVGSRESLDRVLRFRDLWNWVGFTRLFTIPSMMTPHLPEAIWPRMKVADTETDFDTIPFDVRFRPEIREAEMKIVRGFSKIFYTEGPDGAWILRPETAKEYGEQIRAAFPDDLKARTLILLSRNSPLYVEQLTPSERSRDDQAYRDAIGLWQKAGCAAGEYGTGYEVLDFGDRTHLTSRGGQKLAHTVADLVRSLSDKLGYTHRNSPPP